MFSEIQRDFIKQLVLSNKAKYPYYVAYTNSNVSQGGNYDDYNFYVVLSDEPITAQDRYTYVFTGNCCRYGVRSGNASYNYHSERVSTFTTPATITVNNYEFVYTNAEFSTNTIQPDLIATNNVTQSHFDGFSIAILIIIVAIILSKIIRGGGGYAKI